MSRVIKSTYARVDATKPIVIGKKEPAAEAVQKPEPAVEIPPRDLEAEFQDAYDELLAAAQDEVAMILEDARNEAARIRQECEKECEILLAQSQEKGYSEGMEKAGEEVADILGRAQADANATIAAAYDERDKILEKTEPQVLSLSFDIAEKILQIELNRNDTAFMSLIQNALASIKAEKRVILHVNPADYVRFFKSREVTIHTSNGPVSAEVYNDPNSDSYACLIDTESGMVDAGVDAQISQIRHGFGLE